MRKKRIKKNFKIRLNENQIEVAKGILAVLVLGAVITMAAVAPNAVQLFKLFNRQSRRIKKYDQKLAYQTINKMSKKGWVRLSQEDDKTIISITKEGKTEHLKFDLENIIINKPEKWDGLWRIVIFDIPEEYREARNILRSTLKRLGFHKWQKSVFVHPYDCEKEIIYIKEIYEVSLYVKMLIANKIDDEAILKNKFNLT